MKRARQMDVDTPIRPRIIAACVCEEASAWLGEQLPQRWVRELAAEAATVYSNCQRFRRRVHGSKDRGRDYLWMFMRHWLSAKLWERRPHLHARLPAAYASGGELPDRPPAQGGKPIHRKIVRPAGMHVRLLCSVSL